MLHDRKQIEELARTYTEAWCSHDAGSVADDYAPRGTIAINGGEAAGIEEVCRRESRGPRRTARRAFRHPQPVFSDSVRAD
jgi:hypothetical protein